MPTADSLDRSLKKSPTTQLFKAAPPPSTKLAPAPRSNVVADPSAGRYAALEAAAKSSPGAFKAIVKAMNTQAALAPVILKPAQYGSFMNTAGYNAGHAPVTKPKDKPIVKPKVVVPKVVKPVVTPTVVIPTTDTGSTWLPADQYMPFVAPAAPSGGGDSSGSSSGSSGGNTSVKVATPDIITIDQETLPPELMAALIFEDIGGQELLSISRHDLISGGNLEYQSITNLASISADHNSSNIILMPDSMDSYVRNFPISIDTHMIEGFSDLDSSHIIYDTTAKELKLLVTNMKPGEQIEVEILKSVTAYSDTKF